MTTFPADFTFGAATASYQIEGAATQDGKVPSIWDTFAHTPGAIADGSTGDVACDHYHRMESDLDLLADLGVDAYRFSIAWPRIQAGPGAGVNQAGIDFYSRLVDGLLARGIKPAVTLYHWDLPQWAADLGGWLNRDTAQRFAEYAGLVAAHLGDRVSEWMTINEPWCAAFLGYGNGEHAPGHKSMREAIHAAHFLNLAHGLGVQALRAELPASARCGVVWNLSMLYPATDDPVDEAACQAARALSNDLFTEPVLRGRYDPATVQAAARFTQFDYVGAGDLAIIHQPIDFVGLNYYMTWHLRANGDNPADAQFLGGDGPKTAMGWNVDPQGLTDLLVDVHARYPEMDLVVSENGSAWDDVVSPDGQVHDTARTDYLQRHLAAVADALGKGVPVKGYYAWSLLDNFEWSWGYTKRFGLYRTDYDTQARTLKDSGRWFQQFLATRTL
ncbi:MAG: GH1 family beta-glucosidase [Propionibacteriaceae bacterium]|nr:GH1 family beta-glucosidase [Propionibacteriaceae bacterium]